MKAGTRVPSVSVVVPVYHGMKTLGECLEGIKRQEYPGDMEVFVVDDGSTDGSGEYAEKQGFKVLYQTNMGPGAARNAGAEASSGELVVFVDADCVPDPDFVSELVRPLINSDIVGSQGVFYSNQKNLVARFIQAEISERYRMQSKGEFIDWVATYGACYRKNIFQESGGFDEAYSSEDAEFSIRLAQKGHKMVLAPKARCQHLHYENLFKFMKFKLKRAYWSVWLFKKHPKRIGFDRMTPISRKLMMVLMADAVFCLFLGIWWKLMFYVGLGLFGILLVSTLPFSLRIMKQDFVIGLISPFFLFTRTVCYITGLGVGLIDSLRGKTRVKRSSPK